MKKLCLHYFRNFSPTCFLNHKYYYSYLTAPTSLQSHSHLLNLPSPKPYFFIPILPFSTTTATTTSTTTRKPVSIYLMEKLGFSEEQSLAVSKRLLRRRYCKKTTRDPQVTDLISFEISDNVIRFLREFCGLEISHIKKLITKYPLILGADVDKTIKPKIKLLEELSFSNSELALVLSTNPDLYLACDLSPAIQALRGIMGSDQGVVQVLKKFTRVTASKITKNLIPNVTMLENEYGIPRDKIRKFMTHTPLPVIGRTEWLRDVLVRMEDKWGITRDSTDFLRAVRVFSGISDEKIKSKCQVFRSYGWSDSDILSLIRRHANCLGLSEAGIKNKLDFYMNEVGYKPAYMASRTALFSLSLENRVFPRHKVLTILKEKGLIKVDYQLYLAIIFTEDRFLDKFIIPFEGVVPNLREVLVNGRAPCEVMIGRKTSENEDQQ